MPSAFAAVFLFCFVTQAAAELRRGSFTYGTASRCVADGKLSAERCNIAEANARAEFDEKAPRFSTRGACEQAYGGCSLGFSGAGGWRGQRRDIYFTPRLEGFVVRVASERDQVVTPVAKGVAFSSRSILSRNVGVKPYVDRKPAPAQARSRDDGQFGVSTPEPGVAGPPPEAPKFDPNFDCAAAVDLRGKDASNPGCYPAPTHH